MTDVIPPLDGRAGLPPELRILADRYPREGWQGHGNFSELTAFWLERHGMFRQILDKVIADTQLQLDGASPRYGAELSRYTGFFLNQLHGHHTIEDEHYFPKLIGFDARLERAFDMLDADHHALDYHLNQLADHTNAVLSALQQHQNAQDATGRLLEVQTGFQGFLNRHLLDEEEIVVPIILEYAPEIG